MAMGRRKHYCGTSHHYVFPARDTLPLSQTVMIGTCKNCGATKEVDESKTFPASQYGQHVGLKSESSSRVKGTYQGPEVML